LDLGTITITGQNIGLRGRVIDENGSGISGLRITAWDIDVGSKDDLLGKSTTGIDGDYSLSYSPGVYKGFGDSNPDVVVVVYDRGGRELARSQEASDVTETEFVVRDIEISRALAEGVLVTEGGSLPLFFSRNNQVIFLVDGRDLGNALLYAIRNASTSIELMQLWIDTSYVPAFGGAGASTPDASNPSQSLVEALLDANRRGVAVRILLNENAISPDTFDEISDFFGNAGNNSVLVRRFPLNVQTMHAKGMIVDNKEAFIIGSPFQQGYWDTPEHLLLDPRRGNEGLSGIGNRPVHDVSIQMMGPAVADVHAQFAFLWNYRSDEEYDGADKLLAIPTYPSGAFQSIQIVRSLPFGEFLDMKDGVAGVLEAYQRAIGNARDFIYLENQYFSSVDIVNALLSALDSNPNLQLIIVVNEHPDIPTYRQWQTKRLKQLNALSHPRIGVFSLWTCLGNVIKHNYLHSKVAIIDDSWATVGTANLDSVSLSTLSEFGFTHKRNVEMNAVLLDGQSGEPKTGNVAILRRTLWKEHLEETTDIRPSDGWLSLWKNRANANVSYLTQSGLQGHILPYRPETDDDDELAAMGVDKSKIDVIS
jgi:phosphatidylserine/phosphatidylglycerophosphate/cardiolipin synthase-like enzyme